MSQLFPQLLPTDSRDLRNNHLKQHRQQLRDSLSRFHPTVRLVALDWSSSITSQPAALVHRVCAERIINRGSNHQTLRADTSSARKHEDVVWMFLEQLQELTDGEVDDVVEMSVSQGDDEGLEEQIVRAAKGVAKILDLEEPSEKQIADAIKIVEGYSPQSKGKRDQEKPEKGKKDKDGTRYYALLPEIDLFPVLEQRFAKGDVDSSTREAWEKLKKNGRVTRRPHVTIVHKKSLVNTVDLELWEKCKGLQGIGNGVDFSGRLGHVVWDGRVMACTFDDLAFVPPVGAETSSNGTTNEPSSSQIANGGKEGQEFVSKLPAVVRGRLHVTVGTKSGDVPPFEAKDLVEKWKAGNSAADVKSYQLEGVVVRCRIKGMIN